MIEIDEKAKASGYNAIRLKSERNPIGVNIAVLDSYNDILKPVMVTPVKK